MVWRIRCEEGRAKAKVYGLYGMVLSPESFITNQS
jgi:hypothetical protein